MQNYRCNNNQYMRRSNCGCGNNCGNSRNQGIQSDGDRNSCTAMSGYGEHSGCCDRDDALEGMPIAMTYVPWQNWKHIYEAGKGFHRGTIFEELDLPFKGKGGCNS